jgi:hypothetical protein
MNHDVPQPTTAIRAPDAGSRAFSAESDAACAHVSGWEASSAAMCSFPPELIIPPLVPVCVH